MELYALDDQLRRVEVIDQFESCIWTEKFAEKGDLQLSIKSTLATRSLLTPETMLACNKSYRVMQITDIEDSLDDDGNKVLAISGSGLEKILEDRTARKTLTGTTAEATWDFNDTPINIATKIFNDICVTGTLSVRDIIPFYKPGNILPTDTVPVSTIKVAYSADPDNVYNVIKDLADTYGFGFRLVRNFDKSELYFNIYTGVDRTSQQTQYPPVVFSPGLDNLHNTKEVTSTASYKNVAYVFAPAGFKSVYSPTVDDPANLSGFDRKILTVKADDITETDPTLLDALLNQRGLDELAANNVLYGYDGEINQYNRMYIAGLDYNLGDLVELRNDDDISNRMRVSEIIFAHDDQGEREYPTLTLDTTVTPGSWLGWVPTTQKWSELDPDTTTTWDAV